MTGPGCYPYYLNANVVYTYDVYTLTLPRPDFGDTEEIIKKRVQRQTRGGDLKHYRNRKWPKRHSITYDFKNLPEADLENILTFLKNSLGQQVVLNDYYDRNWLGLITNPDEVVVHEGPGCKMATTIKFEGVEIK